MIVNNTLLERVENEVRIMKDKELNNERMEAILAI
jgi:hypothetical protein